MQIQLDQKETQRKDLISVLGDAQTELDKKETLRLQLIKQVVELEDMASIDNTEKAHYLIIAHHGYMSNIKPHLNHDNIHYDYKEIWKN